MRHHASLPLPAPGPARRGDWRVIGTLLPYLWAYKGRVILALAALVAAKVANVGVPVLLKSIVDALDSRTAILAVPLALLVAYGVVRLMLGMLGYGGNEWFRMRPRPHEKPA